MPNFQDYDRVTDLLLYFTDSVTLNFTTVLSRKDRAGNRMHMHYETETISNRFHNADVSRSIKRNMNFYFVIDNKNDFGNGFILRLQDVVILLMAIEKNLFPLYFEPKRRVFKIHQDKLVISGDFEPVTYAQTSNKFIQFTPCVCFYENENSYKEGVTMNVNGEIFNIDIDKFMSFYYILKKTDMYAVACNMVTYAKQPPYGINIYKPVGLGSGGPNPYEDNFGSQKLSMESNNNSGTNNFLNNAKKK